MYYTSASYDYLQTRGSSYCKGHLVSRSCKAQQRKEVGIVAMLYLVECVRLTIKRSMLCYYEIVGCCLKYSYQMF